MVAFLNAVPLYKLDSLDMGITGTVLPEQSGMLLRRWVTRELTCTELFHCQRWALSVVLD